MHNLLLHDATQKGPKGTDKSYSDRIEWETLYHKPVARAKSMPTNALRNAINTATSKNLVKAFQTKFQHFKPLLVASEYWEQIQ